jgi:hypothetical protein
VDRRDGIAAGAGVCLLFPDGSRHDSVFCGDCQRIAKYAFPESGLEHLELAPQDHFICVQSVYADDQNNLWVLDPGSPQQQGVVKEGAKLLKFNPATGALL